MVRQAARRQHGGGKRTSVDYSVGIPRGPEEEARVQITLFRTNYTVSQEYRSEIRSPKQNGALFLIMKYHRLHRIPPRGHINVISYPVVRRKNLADIYEKENISGYFPSAFFPPKWLEWWREQRSNRDQLLHYHHAIIGGFSPEFCVSGPTERRFDT